MHTSSHSPDGEIAALLAGLALAGCGGAGTRGDHPATPGIITQQLENGQWLTAARDYAGTRFSYLSEITPANVAGLKVAWTFSTGVRRGHEAAPLIVGNTMYVVAPFPNTLYAIDLREPGKLKWRYDPVVLQAAQGVACCDVVNRGAAFSGGRIFFNTLDAQTIAVDAETGRELWKTRVGDINKGESMTMAPLVVRDKVLVGNSGGEFGVRGWLTALDASSGNCMARIQHRSGQRRSDRQVVPAILPRGPNQGSGR